MGKRIKRLLVAHAIEYEDGTFDYQAVLECRRFDMTYTPSYRTYGPFAYEDGPPTYELNAVGHGLHTWPDPRGPVTVEEPPTLPPAPRLIEERSAG